MVLGQGVEHGTFSPFVQVPGKYRGWVRRISMPDRPSLSHFLHLLLLYLIYLAQASDAHEIPVALQLRSKEAA